MKLTPLTPLVLTTLALTGPALAAPSGSLSVDRAAPVVPAGRSAAVTLRWQTRSAPGAEVRVSVDGAAPKLMARSSSGSARASWIGAGRVYAFSLRQGAQELDRLHVLGVPAGGGLLRADPARVALPASGGGATTLRWGCDGLGGELWVSRDGAPETLFARGSSGSQRAGWIRASRYRFRLYAPGRARLLDEVEVVGSPGSPGPTTPTNPTQPGPAGADRLQSVYRSLASDTSVDATPRTLVEATIQLAAPQWVLLHSDGRVIPGGSRSAGRLELHVDGRPSGTHAVMDWRGSNNGVMTGINAVAAELLPAGQHRLSLVARAEAGRFTVGSGTNLSVFVRPAERVQASALGQDSQRFAFRTAGVGFSKHGYGVLPHTPVLTHTVQPARGEPLVALAAGTVFHARGRGMGDAMWGLFLDGRYDFADAALRTNLSVTDIWDGAALRAPLFSQAFVAGARFDGSPRRLSLDACEFPWGSPADNREPKLEFHVERGANLVTLHGGLGVAGAIDPLARFLNAPSDFNDLLDKSQLLLRREHLDEGIHGGHVDVDASDFVVPSGELVLEASHIGSSALLPPQED